MTHNNKVYDITEFAPTHPGGSKILLAAGKSVDPYWKVYSIHLKESVENILQQYYIGELEDASIDHSPSSASDSDLIQNPFSGDPERSALLIMRSTNPCNAETPPPLLDSFITPTDIFYVRNHFPVPNFESLTPSISKPSDVKDQVESAASQPANVLQSREMVQSDRVDHSIALASVNNTIHFTLDHLKSLPIPHITVSATLQCAGNRRQEMTKSGTVQGLLWTQGGIGTATFTGVKLHDLLQHFQKELSLHPTSSPSSPLQPPDHKHVQFEGVDGYGASVPIHAALNPTLDILIAWDMNGKPLTRDHGFPLRAIVPGVVAARSVKWLKEIRLSNTESPSHWQQKDYKSFSPSSNWAKLNWQEAAPIMEMPVTSVILEPCQNETIMHDTPFTVRGYAYSGGGRNIVRVDVSLDGGKNWRVAEILPYAGPDEDRVNDTGKVWTWRLWSLDVDEEILAGQLDIVCKAIDASYNNQPESTDPIFNQRGLANNAWHKVTVNQLPPSDT